MQTFNNLIQYQFEGNHHFVYVLIRRRVLFHRLMTTTLESLSAAAHQTTSSDSSVATHVAMDAVAGDNSGAVFSPAEGKKQKVVAPAATVAAAASTALANASQNTAAGASVGAAGSTTTGGKVQIRSKLPGAEGGEHFTVANSPATSNHSGSKPTKQGPSSQQQQQHLQAANQPPVFAPTQEWVWLECFCCLKKVLFA